MRIQRGDSICGLIRDVGNKSSLIRYRDVKEEDAVNVEGKTKNPEFTLLSTEIARSHIIYTFASSLLFNGIDS